MPKKSTPTAADLPAPPQTPVRVGIGGWTFEPWRGSFYPPGLPHAQELAHASRRLTAIEVNGTFYSTFKPDTFRKWREATPEGFVFSLKAHRVTTHRRELAKAGDAVQRFIGSGLAELGDRLGPIVWQFMPTHAFDPADFGAFLELLPPEVDGLALQHVMEVRHPSFIDPAYQALAERHGVATVFTDSPKFPSFDAPQGPIVYARLMDAQPRFANGYAPRALDALATQARGWVIEWPTYVFFINGHKEKAPAAAEALLKRLASTAPSARR